MACDLGFQELANHNPFVRELDELGYQLDFVNGHFVIYGLPYLDQTGALKHGDLISPVALSTEGAIDPPSSHQVWFRGERPHGQGGRELYISVRDNRLEVTPDLIAQFSFSAKLLDKSGQMRDYVSFKEKIETYLDFLTAPALAEYPGTTPFTGIAVRAAAQKSPLRFPDTSSANYNVSDIASLLRGKKIAIVGLGGTGSYILDFVARTHLERIVLFDDDKVHVHTIFRMPGFVPNAIGKKKVEALYQLYANWHDGIEAIDERITEKNIDHLLDFDFVFVSVDDGPVRRLIVDWLSSKSVPFVDCGMGLTRSVVGLNGFVRITGVDRAAFERTIDTAFLPTGNAKEDEYRRQAQIAELNALNAALALIRFKQHFKMYDRLNEAVSYVFETASFEIDRG